MKIDGPSFTQTWNVNLFCSIHFVPDKCISNVNTSCLCPDISLKTSSLCLPPDWGLTSGSHYWKLFRLWSDVRKLLCSDTQPSITMRITQLAQVTGAVFNCESSSSTIYNVCLSVCLFVCLSVCHKSWNSSVNISQSQSEHSLRLTDQSEDSIRSAVSAEISFSI